MTDAKKNQDQVQQTNQSQFLIQRIYIKDISFETPQSPAIFRAEWKPELDLQVATNTEKLADDVHEVVLKITVTVKCDNKVAFLAEVQQAGIFALQFFPDEQIGPILGGVCPGILFPYAREAVSDLVTKATFPPLYLTPINFDALYQQHLAQQNAAAASTATH